MVDRWCAAEQLWRILVASALLVLLSVSCSVGQTASDQGGPIVEGGVETSETGEDPADPAFCNAFAELLSTDEPQADTLAEVSRTAPAEISSLVQRYVAFVANRGSATTLDQSEEQELAAVVDWYLERCLGIERKND